MCQCQSNREGSRGMGASAPPRGHPQRVRPPPRGRTQSDVAFLLGHAHPRPATRWRARARRGRIVRQTREQWHRTHARKKHRCGPAARTRSIRRSSASWSGLWSTVSAVAHKGSSGEISVASTICCAPRGRSGVNEQGAAPAPHAQRATHLRVADMRERQHAVRDQRHDRRRRRVSQPTPLLARAE